MHVSQFVRSTRKTTLSLGTATVSNQKMHFECSLKLLRRYLQL